MKKSSFYKRFLISALTFATLGLGFTFACLAEPVWEVPSKVSQGRAFTVQLQDANLFSATLIWREKRIPLFATQTSTGIWQALALLGMPMDAKTPQSLTLICNDKETKIEIAPLHVPWAEQHITVEPKYVAPPASEQARIEAETARNRAVQARLTPEQSWSLPFQRPLNGGVSSAFGGRRVFNNEPRSPHRGTDLRGPQGTPIKAVADGIIVLAEEQYFSGNVIYIDHGQGVISMYCHLSAFGVSVGDRVAKSQIIGNVGATGRVTGPHLHLGLILQGVAVDAMPLFHEPLIWQGGPTKEDPAPAGN